MYDNYINLITLNTQTLHFSIQIVFNIQNKQGYNVLNKFLCAKLDWLPFWIHIKKMSSQDNIVVHWRIEPTIFSNILQKSFFLM